MSDKPLLKRSSKQWETEDGGPSCLPLWRGTLDSEDTASLSLSIASSPASCPPASKPTVSRSSSTAWSDNLRSSPLASSPSTIPLPDSRACSPHPPSAWNAKSHARQHSSIRSSEFCTGRWIAPRTRKSCSDLLLASSPLRAPPMLPVIAQSDSAASSLSKASGSSYATNVSTSTAPTSILDSPASPSVGISVSPVDVTCWHRKRPSTSGSSGHGSVLQYRSLSDSISEAYDKLCDKLKKSLRVMWKQGKRYEVDMRSVEREVAEADGIVDAGAATGTKVKEYTISKHWKRTSVEGVYSVENGHRERTDSLQTNATSVATDSEPSTKQSKRQSAGNLDKASVQRKDSGTESESPLKHWKRKSAESIRNLDKAYRQRMDSLTKASDTATDASPKAVEKALPSVPEIADFMDLRDPFACHSSGSPQVVKNRASVLPPPPSLPYCKVIEARKRRKRADRAASPGRGNGRPGSAGSTGSVGRSRSRRIGGSAAARRLRPMITKRVADTKSSQVVGASKCFGNPKLASPPNTLVSVTPSKPPRPPTPNLLAMTPPLHQGTLGFPSSTSFAASRIFGTTPNSLGQATVRSPSPLPPPATRSQKRSSGTPLFVPFSVSLPPVPVIGSSSFLPTPPLTPSSPTSPDWSPSFPSTPVSTRTCSPNPEIRHAKFQPSPLPPRIPTPPLDDRAWF